MLLVGPLGLLVIDDDGGRPAAPVVGHGPLVELRQQLAVGSWAIDRRVERRQRKAHRAHAVIVVGVDAGAAPIGECGGRR